MTPEFAQWLTANDQYLALALGWLRVRLDQLAEEVHGAPPAPAAPAPAAAPQSAQRARPVLGRLFPGAQSAPLRSLPAPGPVVGEAGGGAAPAAPPQAMLDAEQADPPPALMMLARRMGLTRFETMTMLMCVAIELDPHMGVLYARAQGDAPSTGPSFALAMKLFAEPSWDAMSPERPLRYWRLIDVGSGSGPLVGAQLKADERIVNYVKGLNYLDQSLAPLLTAAVAPLEPLPPSQQTLADTIAAQARRGLDSGQVPLFQLLGADSQGKLLVAHAAAYELDLTLYRLRAEQLPTQTAELETLIRLWRREAALLPLALLVEAGDTDRAGAHAAPLMRLMERDSGLLIVDAREPWPEGARETVTLDVARPSPAEQAVLWREALGDAAASHPQHLAAHFNFNAPAIRQIATGAMRDASGDALGAALWRASLQRARPALDQLARVVDAKSGWSDLELPETEKALLQQVIDQVRSRSAVYDAWGFRERMNRGLGISVLFAGESGTGKTMAAEVIARELGLLIFRIDLSAVVSKYIGETEKNLRKLFDAAEDGGAILFFDEADALFGKRSEVRDSHDRYANIEINYLLQRIEAFRGLAILASNMKASLDPAFMRRLRFVVNFPFPGPEERASIWKNVFPAQVPLARLDYERLGRLNLTGGSIHNIALNAAFAAAGRGVQVSMPLLLEAARTELRKLEKPINEADLRWVEPAPQAAGAPA